ncbi:hypothetical protein HYC85_013481 [Camellia sinensis]|uniref:Uncharacterized protein n=1 Tax=Camellia sinensis TaxID=4442 RepID=A0A7J7H6P1_CAMSI|nr:hypothetical protein HYC85_013481 [Camellia sinensis]
MMAPGPSLGAWAGLGPDPNRLGPPWAAGRLQARPQAAGHFYTPTHSLPNHHNPSLPKLSLISGKKSSPYPIPTYTHCLPISFHPLFHPSPLHFCSSTPTAIATAY